MGALYEISERYRNLLDAAADMDDEAAIAEIEAAIKGVDSELTEAVYNGIGYLQELDRLIEGAETEKKRMDARIKSLKAHKERVRRGYTAALIRAGKERIDTDRGRMIIPAPTYSTVIDDVTKLPPDYTRQTIKIEPDKTSIKQAIQAGKTIPGAHLEASRVVRIR